MYTFFHSAFIKQIVCCSKFIYDFCIFMQHSMIIDFFTSIFMGFMLRSAFVVNHFKMPRKKLNLKALILDETEQCALTSILVEDLYLGDHIQF